MTRITVQPGGPDRRVPVENLKNVFFEQDVPRDVNRTDYIERRLRDGDLIEVPAKVAAPAKGVAA